MRILHLSDTHNQHKNLGNLPEADLIIHSGDFSFAGTESEFRDFLKWFLNLNCQYKIFIGGNHDGFLEENSQKEIQSILPKKLSLSMSFGRYHRKHKILGRADVCFGRS